ncbi:hypothetical protein SAMN04488519_103381 [Algoriphagus ornithinivorans]|uniref:Uncharacterized protein n=1 Tax=Algoriphagus ornithinivorans TaxID=226506 RepID=A0A1I5EC92_9BACT|nr:hypothetical protein [Algoriphagus ornithinivorans]SFO08963.1 hypothetical protein SAMN04488519_103381 [Algoriphagus ornithinivorans]
MKRLLSILILLNFTLGFSQSIKLIEKPTFKGAVFPETYKILYTQNPPEERRFTPTIAEIEKLETQLRKDIREINKNKPNHGKDYGPVIHRNLSKYVRQYIGFIDEDGQKVIHVNFLWNHYSLLDSIRGWTKPDDRWKTEWQMTFDGGSRFWNIKYLVDENKFIDFRVNGVA